jgi:hypothetical protein
MTCDTDYNEVDDHHHNNEDNKWITKATVPEACWPSCSSL